MSEGETASQGWWEWQTGGTQRLFADCQFAWRKVQVKQKCMSRAQHLRIWKRKSSVILTDTRVCVCHSFIMLSLSVASLTCSSSSVSAAMEALSFSRRMASTVLDPLWLTLFWLIFQTCKHSFAKLSPVCGCGRSTTFSTTWREMWAGIKETGWSVWSKSWLGWVLTKHQQKRAND